MSIPHLKAADTALLVVDMQEGLLPHMHNGEAVVAQVQKLLDGAAVLGLPVMATEQYPQRLGATDARLAERLEDAVLVASKLQFSACLPDIAEQLAQRQIRSVLVCGIETHICVLQTCLDLAERGYVTAVVGDAVGSRRIEDQRPAILRMAHAGIIPTTVESALLEMVHEAGGPLFKAMLPIIK